jgi:hypothetical protein
MISVAKYMGNGSDVSIDVLDALRSCEERAFHEIRSKFSLSFKDYTTQSIHDQDVPAR